ncbi:phospholipid phosphatase-related protein type 2 isoform X4 [Macaca mulatta]
MAGGRPHLKRSFSIIPCFVFVESVLLGIVILLAYRLEFTDTFPVHTQGFFCYDSTYAKPYPGPEAASRVPPALIYALVTAGPTLTILLGELARAFFPAPPSAVPVIGESTIVSGACCRFSPPLRRLVRFLGVYSFGLFTTTIFANAGQVVTGNPTPHFLSVCRPNYTALGCLPPSPDRPGPDRFVTDQGACAGSPSLVAAARRAFPCKDAALCAYAVTYTAMYVTLVFRVKGSRLVKPSLCLALLCPAFLVGVVRVAEYRNHWSDVLAGFLTGAAIATFLVSPLLNLPSLNTVLSLCSRSPALCTTFRAGHPLAEGSLPGRTWAKPPPWTAPSKRTRGLQAAFDTGTAHPIQVAELRPPWPPDPQLRVLQGPSHVFVAPCAPPSIEV